MRTKTLLSQSSANNNSTNKDWTEADAVSETRETNTVQELDNPDSQIETRTSLRCYGRNMFRSSRTVWIVGMGSLLQCPSLISLHYRNSWEGGAMLYDKTAVGSLALEEAFKDKVGKVRAVIPSDLLPRLGPRAPLAARDMGVLG